MTDITNKLTVVITGHYVDGFEKYFQYLIHSLKDELNKCQFLLYYDESSFGNVDYSEITKIEEVLKKYDISNYLIKIKRGGLLTAFYYMLQEIKTSYFLFLEHDWVFLETPSYDKIVQALDNHEFVKCVKFKKLGNIEKQLNSNRDYTNNKIPFVRDERIKEMSLIQACYWSNNPFICKLDVMKQWSENFLNETIIQMIENNSLNRGSRGIEEIMIKKYTNDLTEFTWEEIKDVWGTYLYGDVGMGPIIGHTDGSRHYDGIPEQLGKQWIEDNKNFLK